MLLAFGSARAVAGLGWLRRHTRALQIFGGVLLIVVGVALVTGVWNDFISWLRDAFVSDVSCRFDAARAPSVAVLLAASRAATPGAR